MIIQFLPQSFNNKFRNNIVTGSNNSLNPNVSYKNLNQPAKDTVSFSGGEKILKTKTHEITYDLAKKVYNNANEDLINIKWVLKKYLKPLIATNTTPENPICPEKIGLKYRIKGPESIREKATSRGITRMKDLVLIGDIIGARVILRDAKKNSVEKILKQLSTAVRNGDLKLVEVENHYPVPEASYATEKALKAIAKEANLPVITEETKSGYRAIHLTAKTKHGYHAEIQIMGRDVEDLKEIEDICYKIRCKKGVPAKYRLIEEEVKPAIESLSKPNEKLYMRYINDSYDFAAKLPPRKINSRKKQEYIPIPYFLPKALDFLHLAQMKEVCDKLAKVAINN